MTLFDLIKMYGTGNGEGVMWKTIQSISDAVERSMPEQGKKHLLRSVYGDISGSHYNQEFANDDIRKMYYIDRNKNRHDAPYWPSETVREIYESIKGEIKPYNACDFEVTMNMVASDNWPLLEKWFPGIDEDERNQKTVELALNFLKDPDTAHPESKIWEYLKK